MTKSIKWLHFSDLHYGQESQSFLMSRFKNELFRDIKEIGQKLGGFDVIFFSGDLSQSGNSIEFEQLNVFLNELYNELNKISSNPFLIAIPGNHDLTRINSSGSVNRALRTYSIDTDFQHEFWTNLVSGNEYYDYISASFYNFNQWYERCSFKKPELVKGLIPGDISTIIEVRDFKMGIIGLNSSFLELSGDNYKSKLGIHPDQVSRLTSEDPFKWLHQNDMNILMTHHDPSWYDPTAKRYYESELNPPGTYFNHLCGHLHEPTSENNGTVGSPLRRIQIAPSLFGLEKINNTINRIHGYFAGEYIIENEDIIERFWPRIMISRYNKSLTIGPDHGFELNGENFCETTFKKAVISKAAGEQRETFEGDEVDIDIKNKANVDILDGASSESISENLESLPKGSYLLTNYNLSVRKDEQESFIANIKEHRHTWLITDWGLNENGFIGSTLPELEIDALKSCFTLNCEDFTNVRQIVDGFFDQFNISLPKFCSLVDSVGNSLLVLNQVPSAIYESHQECIKFNEIVKSILDYSTKLSIVIIVRKKPPFLKKGNYVKLTPLDLPQIKEYIKNYPETDEEFQSENLEKLLTLTSGLPKHLDRILDQLRVTTLSEIFEPEIDQETLHINDNDPVPKSLEIAINSLTQSEDKYTNRSYKLLKVLTILANGEALSVIKRFYSDGPFFPQNATELEQLSLLEVITVSKTIPTVATSKELQNVKILRVPRQVRDRVNAIMLDEEKHEITKRACDIYLGSKWREGVIRKTNMSPLTNNSHFLNSENSYLVLKNLLLYALKSETVSEIERAALLCVSYCKVLYKQGDYKNSLNSSGEIYHLLKGTELTKELAGISKVYGESLRMIGQREKAIVVLEEAISLNSELFTNSEKSGIYTDLAYAYENENNEEKALFYAKLIKTVAENDSSNAIQADSIIAKYTLKEEPLLKRIRTLENKSRTKDLMTGANNLALQIVGLTTDYREKIKYLEKVLKTEDDYNRIRAVIRKCTICIDTKRINEITQSDLILLNQSYSYLYSQRLKVLFNNCHKALWEYCLNKGRFSDLLQLFRHSSFVWRIFDEIELEKAYFNQLQQHKKFDINKLVKDNNNSKNIEYYNKRKSVLT